MTVVEEARRATATRISIPYKGLRFFTEDDTEIFFGRETERRLIGMTLRATRFSVVYGESGVGKSSLLRAGVIHDLREKTMADLQERRADGSLRSPPFVPLVFSNWRDDPLPELDACIGKAAEALALSFEAPSGKATTLDRLLEGWCAALDTTLVVVFDQFEEYLMYHPAAGSESFDAGLARVVTNRDVRVRIALSIREDALAKLDRYEKRIPGLFDNSIRVEHLDRAAGRAAIRGPVDRFNAGLSEKEQPVKLQDQLVEDVLTQVEANEIVTDHAGRGVVASDGRRQPIEAPFLQLVMERLWKEESKSGSRILRSGTLERLGGASKIVLTHLDQALADMDEDDQAVAAAVFRDLVTPSRQKIAHTPSDLAKLEEGQVDGLDEARVRDVLESLAKRRVVRPVAPAPDSTEQRYEIFHDKLADPVLDWRTRHVQAAHAKDADRRARRARLRAQLYAGAALIMLAVAAGCLVLWQQAINAKKSARAQELVAESASKLPVDPARSVVLVARAIAKKDSPSAQAALRAALWSSRLRFLIRHKDDVYSAKYNDGGTRILTMSSDRTARVSDAATGRTIRTLGYGKNFSDADVSRDGKRVVTAGWDDTVRVWDVDSGATRARWKNPNVSTVRFDHTGSRVVSSTYTGELVRVFTIGRKSPQVFKVGPGRRAALWGAEFDSTGTRIVCWGENTVPRIVHLRTGRVMRLDRGKGHTNWVQAAAFSPDGRLVLTGSVDQRAIVWDAQTGEPLRQVRAQSGIQAVAFSPNGRRFATTSAKRAHVWQTKTGARLAELRGHTDWVYGVSFRPKDGDLLATASFDGSARVWDIASESTLAALLVNENLNTAVFSPNGKNVLTSSDDGTARVWAVDSGRELRGHGGWVLDAQFNTKGDRILTAGEDHRVVLWDALSGKSLWRLRNAGKREVSSVRFSGDGRLFVLASNDDTAQIRGGENGELIATITDNEADVRAADFSPDGKLVVTGADNGWVGIFNSSDGASVQWLEDKESLSGNAHDYAVTGVDWSPDGRYIVTTGSDDVARVWNPKTGRRFGTFRNHRGYVYSPSFSRDSRFVVTGGNDRTARVWNVATQKEVSRLDGPAPVRATAFSPTRPWVATGGPEGVVRVWNWRTGQLLAVLRNHADYVNAVTFSPDGKLLLSASDDRTAKLYGCETCESIGPLQPLIDRYERYFGEGR